MFPNVIFFYLQSQIPLCIKKSALPKFNDWITKLSSEGKSYSDSPLQLNSESSLEYLTI